VSGIATISTSLNARTILSWARRNVHFFVAAAVLLATAGASAPWVEKEPVPWPVGVDVDEGFFMRSLPDKMGPYVLMKDGDVLVSKEDMASLMIGTSKDRNRLPERRSNWYAVKRYEDTRLPERSAYRIWQLEAYYYTGVRDKVPHVPERCLAAGGATVGKSESVRFSLSAAGARNPWGSEVEFLRVPFQQKQRARQTINGVTYYTFALNGEPSTSWIWVRTVLGSPWARYCYFAKIQVSPLGVNVGAPAEADARAREFITWCLPEVLKALPTPADVKRLSLESP